MKNLRQLCAAVALTLALAAPAAAGNISTGVASPPPPPATQGNISTGSPSTQGTIHTGVTNQESAEDGATASDSVTEIALTLLQSVLSLF